MSSVISHRGWWKVPGERNTLSAFTRSFEAGFGTETDLRDSQDGLVISHDPPLRGALPAQEFFLLYKEIGQGLPLALNIKADGLQRHLAELLQEFHVENYFVFDMAVPDALAYLDRGLNVFTRHSEVETVPAFYERSNGVWLDEFRESWLNESVLRSHLNSKKRVAVVSPELHLRPRLLQWQICRNVIREFGESCLLCTDFPDEAEDYING